MRILITAGGTLETIDDVRNIKNSSTGRLGKIIADKIPGEHIVDYIHGQSSLLPKRSVNLYEIEGVQDLDDRVVSLLDKKIYDVVIFAMAVSDYMIQSVTTYEHLVNNLENKDDILHRLMDYKEDLDRNQKIRSNHDHLAVLMKKAPKVIGRIKEKQPDTTLVGFKLLVDVETQDLVNEAQKLIHKNKADYVLANDLTSIKGDNHTGYLIDKTGIVSTKHTKQDIAQEILERLDIL